jgi:hypothetical protein
MATKWQEKNVGVVLKYKPGAKRRTEVRSEIDGTKAGAQVEHHSGRVDAEITPATVRGFTRTEKGSD